MNTKKFSLVGKASPRQDGVEKVAGKALFADDINLSGQLYGVMVRVAAAHAVIREIDLSAAQADKNVSAIITADDVPGAQKVGVIRDDQPVFCNERIVTPGDVVAMLLGESPAILRKVAKKVKIYFDPLPVLSDPRKALDADAPLIHPDTGTNLITHHPLRKGDAEMGLAESDEVLEQTYTTRAVEHAYIEPECVLAQMREGNKGIQITGSVQNPFTTRRIVAAVLGWPLARVSVHQTDLGGSFGGKDDIMNILAARAAVGALKTHRPVKIRYRREESILESYKRHPYIMHYKVGYNRDGHIRAMKIDILADGGAYTSMSPYVTWRSVVQATGPYVIEHVSTDVRAVYTNNPYTGAMRGFGSPQPIFAQESIMDEIAVRLNMAPDEIRRINGYQPGSVTATGHKLENHDVNLQKVLQTATDMTNFHKTWQKYHKNNAPCLPQYDKEKILLSRKNFIAKKDWSRRGIGLAVSFRGCSLGAEGIDAAASYLSVQQDGSVYLLSGLAENGQGMRTTYAIIAAEVLGIAVSDIYYLDLDTSHVPDSGPTVASRATLMGGSAVKAAAEQVRDRLTDLLRSEWQLSTDSVLEFRDKRVTVQNSKLEISFADLCRMAYGKGINLAALGWYPGPKVHWDEEKGQGPAYFTYVYGCQVAEVTVNVVTGEVYVDKLTAVHDPGRVINLLGAQGQVYGGVTQGAGYGLWEEISVHDGFIRELNFDQYLMPTSKDLGEIVPVFVEGEDIYGPWGAKSLGEPTLELTAAAVANAVCNAVGQRFFNLPLNLEEIVLGRKLYPPDTVRGSAK